jgi:hypothetical protein
VVITAPPGPLFAGVSQLTLTCTISINPATDVSLRPDNINVIWLKEDRVLNSDGAALQSSNQMFISYLTLPSLSTFDNNSNYTCRAIIMSNDIQEHLSITSSEDNQHTIAIKVQSKLKIAEKFHYRKSHSLPFSLCSSLR